MAVKKKAVKKEAKKTKASEKKPELEKMSQTHGMVEEKTMPRTLEQAWGDKGVDGKYNTLVLAEYKKQLGHMTKTDLKSHAVTVGLIPIDNAGMLLDRLIREFKIHASSYNRPLSTSNEVEISPEIRNILDEGK